MAKNESQCTYLLEKLDKYDELKINVILDGTLEENIVKIIREEENEKTYFK